MRSHKQHISLAFGGIPLMYVEVAVLAHVLHNRTRVDGKYLVLSHALAERWMCAMIYNWPELD